MKVWIDTDIGTNPDDALALAVGGAHAAVTLAGVSTVDDEDGRRAAIARDVLNEAGHDRVRVVDGRSFQAGVLREAGADALLAIGPLSNVAVVVTEGLHPPHIAVMGGALHPVHHRGERREIESNFGADPAAAALVLEGARVLLVPLDVTARVCLDDKQRAHIAARRDSLHRALAAWPHAVCLHDPLALLALAGEPIFTIEPMRLRVVSSGRVVEDSDAPVHDVVTDVDVNAAIARIVQLINGEAH